MKEGRSDVLGSPSAQVEAPARVCYNFYIEVSLGAPLAQLDRASGYEPEGREFESLRARHFHPGPARVRPGHMGYTQRTKDIDDTLGPNGFSSGSSTRVSRSKYPRS